MKVSLLTLCFWLFALSAFAAEPDPRTAKSALELQAKQREVIEARDHQGYWTIQTRILSQQLEAFMKAEVEAEAKIKAEKPKE